MQDVRGLAGARGICLWIALVLACGSAALADSRGASSADAMDAADALARRVERQFVQRALGRSDAALDVASMPEVALLQDAGPRALRGLARLVGRSVMAEPDFIALAGQRKGGVESLAGLRKHYGNELNKVAATLLARLGPAAAAAVSSMERRLATAMNDDGWILAAGPAPQGAPTGVVHALVEALGAIGPEAASTAWRVAKILTTLEETVAAQGDPKRKAPKAHRIFVQGFSVTAIAALGRIGSGAAEHATPVLSGVLVDGTKTSRAAALRALLDADALPLAGLMQARTEAEPKRRKALDAAMRRYAKARMEAHADAGADDLWEATTDLRVAADVIYVDVRKLVRKKSGSPAFRAMLARVLGRVQERAGSAATVLTAMLDEDDVDVQAGALEGLAELGTQGRKAIPRMLEFLASTSPLHRTLAAEALGASCGSASVVVPALGKALDDEHADVRAAAAYALRSYKASVRPLVPLLEKLRDDPNLDVQRAAKETLAHLGR